MFKNLNAETVFGLMATIFLTFTLAGVMIASRLYIVPLAIGITALVLQFISRNK